MDRRGFFGRFAAAAAAFTVAASGRGTSAAAAKSKPVQPVSRTAKQVAISADTSKFEKSIGEAGREVVEMLRQCRVVHYETSMSAGMLPEVRAVFKKTAPSAPRTDMDRKAWELIERGALRSVQVNQSQDVDCFRLGDPMYRPAGVQYEIEATWIVVNP